MNPDELNKLLTQIGIDPASMSDEDKAEVSKALALVQKAAGDEGDEEPEDNGVVKGLIALIGDLIKQGKARKSADEPKDEPVEDPKIVAMQKRLDEQEEQLAAEREGTRVAKAVGSLEAARSAKRITPAACEAAMPIVEHLARTEVEHVSKSADGADETTPMWEYVIAALECDTAAKAAFAPLFEEEGAGGPSKDEIWKHEDKRQAAEAGDNGDK